MTLPAIYICIVSEKCFERS